jgi:hypothetical protein
MFGTSGGSADPVQLAANEKGSGLSSSAQAGSPVIADQPLILPA